MHLTIVIPSYWTRNAGAPRQADDGIFDHPTPLDHEGTLGRCLESLKILRDVSFDVLVITASANSALDEAVGRKVEQILAPFHQHFPLAQFDVKALRLVRQALEDKGFDPQSVGLDNYSRIRNCQLIGPHGLGSDLIVALDDDEIITDPNFLNKAIAYVGQTHNGVLVDGISGIYLDAQGKRELLESPDARISSNLFQRKDAIMNDAQSAYLAQPGEIVETVTAYGGNMVFTRALFERVAFDPWVARGEDIDYVLNSRLVNRHWFLQRDLCIVHLPPGTDGKGSHFPPTYSKLQQDTRRFLYERAKLAEAAQRADYTPLPLETLVPYPGQFLRDDLEDHALEALTRLRPADADAQGVPAPEEFVRQALHDARSNASRYFAFAQRWPSMMAALAEHQAWRDYLRSQMSV